MNTLEDWGAIALICPCQSTQIPTITNPTQLKDIGFRMDDSNPRYINFVCDKCQNCFDYEIKYKLFELLEKFYNKNGTYEGFSKYISRKNENIRLKYIKTLHSSSKNIILIEAANLSRHPEFKLNK